MKKLNNKAVLKPIFHDFHVLTLESAFVTRTFFFVLFGITIHLTSLIDLRIAIVSSVIIACLYLVRWISLLAIVQKAITPQLYIAPRGLITILLFYAIPDGWMNFHGEMLDKYNSSYDMTILNFESGILLFTILITSLVMMVSLVVNRGGKMKDVLKMSVAAEEMADKTSFDGDEPEPTEPESAESNESPDENSGQIQ